MRFMNTFHENLKEAMTIKQISTKELADKTGIKEGTISSYLKTKGAIPSIITGWKLAEALGVSVQFLVTGFENNSEEKQDLYKSAAKHAKILSSLDAIPEEVRSPIEYMINDMGSKYSAQKKD